MDIKVNKYRTTAKVVGTLYILGFVVGIAGSVLGTPGQLATVSARSMMIAMGALTLVPRKIDRLEWQEESPSKLWRAWDWTVRALAAFGAYSLVRMCL